MSQLSVQRIRGLPGCVDYKCGSRRSVRTSLEALGLEKTGYVFGGLVSSHLFYDLWDFLDTRERGFQLAFLTVVTIVSAPYSNMLVCVMYAVFIGRKAFSLRQMYLKIKEDKRRDEKMGRKKTRHSRMM